MCYFLSLYVCSNNISCGLRGHARVGPDTLCFHFARLLMSHSDACVFFAAGATPAELWLLLFIVCGMRRGMGGERASDDLCWLMFYAYLIIIFANDRYISGGRRKASAECLQHTVLQLEMRRRSKQCVYGEEREREGKTKRK